ncbi:MAG: hypothetical protein RL375_3920 [Pseudomonadota bacterium]
MPAAITLGALKPEDSFAAFAARGLLRPSFRWQDVWQAEHARAFAVAGVMRLDVLRLIRDQVDAAVREGRGFEEFDRGLRGQLVAKGFWGNVEITDPATGEVRTSRFDKRRLQLIFDVNMRQSHAAGRWARAQRSRMPYLVYRTMRDERVRASHKPWDNVVLPKGHPWWDTHYPPNGWRCRCTAFAVDEKGLQALRDSGAKVTTEPPPTTWVEFENKSTGQVERVPRGIDPGFAYNPGKVHVEQGIDRLARAITTARAPLPAQASSAQTGALQVARAVIARGRSERAFKDFIADPPKGVNTGLPVAAVPAPAGQPVVASVRASDLVRQRETPDFPRVLPTRAAEWAVAQAVVDRGQRLELPGGGVLWWWARGGDGARRVHVLELQRGQLVWWVQQLTTLTPDEAVATYPALKGLL